MFTWWYCQWVVNRNKVPLFAQGYHTYRSLQVVCDSEKIILASRNTIWSSIGQETQVFLPMSVANVCYRIQETEVYCIDSLWSFYRRCVVWWKMCEWLTSSNHSKLWSSLCPWNIWNAISERFESYQTWINFGLTFTNLSRWLLYQWDFIRNSVRINYLITIVGFTFSNLYEYHHTFNEFVNM